jgi:hypothetical protein
VDAEVLARVIEGPQVIVAKSRTATLGRKRWTQDFVSPRDFDQQPIRLHSRAEIDVKVGIASRIKLQEGIWHFR